jgi:hypothetical protein
MGKGFFGMVRQAYHHMELGQLGGFRLELSVRLTHSYGLALLDDVMLHAEQRLGGIEVRCVPPEDVVAHMHATVALARARGCSARLKRGQAMGPRRFQAWAYVANALGLNCHDIRRHLVPPTSMELLFPATGAALPNAGVGVGMFDAAVAVPPQGYTPQMCEDAMRHIMVRFAAQQRFRPGHGPGAGVKFISLVGKMGQQTGSRQPDTHAGKRALVQYVLGKWGGDWRNHIAWKDGRSKLPVRKPVSFHMGRFSAV